MMSISLLTLNLLECVDCKLVYDLSVAFCSSCGNLITGETEFTKDELIAIINENRTTCE